jgi:hypothetical protein
MSYNVLVSLLSKFKKGAIMNNKYLFLLAVIIISLTTGCATNRVINVDPSTNQISSFNESVSKQYAARVAAVVPKDLFTLELKCNGLVTIRGIPNLFVNILSKKFKKVEILSEGQEISPDEFDLIARITNRTTSTECAEITFNITFNTLSEETLMTRKLISKYDEIPLAFKIFLLEIQLSKELMKITAN